MNNAHDKKSAAQERKLIYGIVEISSPTSKGILNSSKILTSR
jgi:hypothetical protein